jgi:hypothetical protein
LGHLDSISARCADAGRDVPRILEGNGEVNADGSGAVVDADLQQTGLRPSRVRGEDCP